MSFLGRPAYNIDEFRADIQAAIKNGSSHAVIAHQLLTDHGIPISRQTLTRRIAAWELSKYNPLEHLDDHVLDHFWRGYNDTEIALSFKIIYKVDVSTRTVERSRASQDLIRRMGPEARHEYMNQVREYLERLLQNNTAVSGYGIRSIQEHLRTLRISSTRDALMVMIREIDPIGTSSRTTQLTRQRGEYIVPGPDFLWSVDGHDKLAPFGIQIYACIDAYSRYIVWIYVGISSRTSQSVKRQYLETVHARTYHPKFIRSDHGTETPLMAEAHFALSTKSSAKVKRFSDCYLYGGSIHNQRIERFWGLLQQFQLGQWRDYFWELNYMGYYNADQISDRIAFLAVYMPLIWAETTAFVAIHNQHKICKQPNKPNSQPGRPDLLYHYPQMSDTVRYGGSIDAVLVEELLQEDTFDLNEYLPPSTLKWINEYLMSRDIVLAGLERGVIGENGEQLHRTIYLELRLAVCAHMKSGQEPILVESTKPTGGYSAVPSGSRFQDLIRSNHTVHDRHMGHGGFGEIRDENGDILDAELAKLLQDHIASIPNV